jgi:hypothetical protein
MPGFQTLYEIVYGRGRKEYANRVRNPAAHVGGSLNVDLEKHVLAGGEGTLQSIDRCPIPVPVHLGRSEKLSAVE